MPAAMWVPPAGVPSRKASSPSSSWARSSVSGTRVTAFGSTGSPRTRSAGPPEKDTSPRRVRRGSRVCASRRAAATSAERIESPGSVLRSPLVKPISPNSGWPSWPSPSTSAPLGAAVETEVSITITTSSLGGPARPATKRPQPLGPTTRPSEGCSISRETVGASDASPARASGAAVPSSNSAATPAIPAWAATRLRAVLPQGTMYPMDGFKVIVCIGGEAPAPFRCPRE